jgi:hypothetical protein
MIPLGKISTYMSKARVENPFINLGRIRRRKNMIRGRDSNLLSIEIALIKIIKTSMIRMSPIDKSPWKKGEYHQSNVVDANRITCTWISLT